MAVQGQGVEDDLGDESEGALGADHQAPQDLHRGRSVQERVEAVAVGVLDLVLGTDPGGEPLVGLDLGLQRQQLVAQVRFRVAQQLVGVRLTRVDHRAARQDEGQRGDRTVRIPGGARGHARGVVGHDPTDGAGDGTGGIGAKDPPVPGERGIGPHDGGPGPDPGPGTAVEDLDPRPVPAYVDEDVLALRLAVEAGAGGPEDDTAAVAVRVGEDRRDVVQVLGDHDDLRQEAVRARIGGIPHQVRDLPEHLLRTEQGGQAGPQFRRAPRRLPAGHPIGGRGTCRTGAQGFRLRLQQRHVRVPSTARCGGRTACLSSGGAPASRRPER